MKTLTYVHGIFSIVILFLQISEASSSVCPSGWTSNGTNCYFFSSFTTDWHSANNDCQQRGAHLASIHSESENTFISSFDSSNHIWIGYNNLNQEGSYRWTDGSALDFSNWGSGQPDNLGGEHCVVVNFGDFGAWNDYSCDRLRRYICVKKGSSSTPTTAAQISPTSATLATPTETSAIDMSAVMGSASATTPAQISPTSATWATTAERSVTPVSTEKEIKGNHTTRQ